MADFDGAAARLDSERLAQRLQRVNDHLDILSGGQLELARERLLKEQAELREILIASLKPHLRRFIVDNGRTYECRQPCIIPWEFDGLASQFAHRLIDSAIILETARALANSGVWHKFARDGSDDEWFADMRRGYEDKSPTHMAAASS